MRTGLGNIYVVEAYEIVNGERETWIECAFTDGFEASEYSKELRLRHEVPNRVVITYLYGA